MEQENNNGGRKMDTLKGLLVGGGSLLVALVAMVVGTIWAVMSHVYLGAILLVLWMTYNVIPPTSEAHAYWLSGAVVAAISILSLVSKIKVEK